LVCRTPYLEGPSMEDQLVRILIPVTGLLTGLIGTYVGLQNRALLAEVRKEIAEMENRIFERINGRYIRRSECELREQLVGERLAAMAETVKNKEAAGE
jgi:hypothetical protein